MAENFANTGDLSHPQRGRGLGGFELPKEPSATLSSSEDATRHSKSSESVVSAFAAEGFGAPPSGLATLVADYVNMSTRSIPIKTLANMAPGSGNLGTAASAGVSIAIGSLTPDQRQVMRAGGNPLSPADMASIGAKLGLAGYAMYASREGGIGGNNSGKYTGMKESGGLGGKEGSYAHAQHINALGKMSGDDFASRLGFHGDQAKEFGKMFQGTSGTFRSTAEDYNRVMGDPNATPEQKKEAVERMHRAAKTTKEKETAKKFQEAIEKMKADGVDVTNKEAVQKYREKHRDVDNALTGDRAKNENKFSRTSSAQADAGVQAKVRAAAAAAPPTDDPKIVKTAAPKIIQKTL